MSDDPGRARPFTVTVPPSQRKPKLGDKLSKRELQCLAAVAAGLTSPEIAARLHISPDTVKSHIYRVGIKLGTVGRANAVWEACLQRLLTERMVYEAGSTRVTPLTKPRYTPRRKTT
jgi:DNA-binding CsgD family transcriptional regulator